MPDIIIHPWDRQIFLHDNAVYVKVKAEVVDGGLSEEHTVNLLVPNTDGTTDISSIMSEVETVVLNYESQLAEG